MKREPIKLAQDTRWANLQSDGIVPAYRIGALAPHNITPSGDLTWNWMISHIPTGRHIKELPFGMAFKFARELTMFLDQAFEWEYVTVDNAWDIRFKVRQFFDEKLPAYAAWRGK